MAKAIQILENEANQILSNLSDLPIKFENSVKPIIGFLQQKFQNESIEVAEKAAPEVEKQVVDDVAQTAKAVTSDVEVQ